MRNKSTCVVLAILCVLFFGSATLLAVSLLARNSTGLSVAPGSVKTRLAWFYKPPNDSDLTTLAKRFDFYILTHGDESERDVLLSRGVKGPMLQYLRFEAIQNPALCKDRQYCSGDPWGNQIAYKPGDFAAISRDHPDWFLRDAGGKLIIMDDSFVMMDPGNAGWQAFFLERVREMQAQFGWNGAFLDNVEASLDKIRRSGKWPARYPDDASYQSAVLAFLKYLYTGYFQPHKRPVYANIIELGDSAVWFKYLSYLDGAMDEAWAVGYHGYLGPGEWFSHLERVEKAQAMGKWVILVSQGEQLDTSRQQFAFASYLLINNGRTVFRYANSVDGYQGVWLYGNYFQALGDPIERYICPLNLLCLREFSRGWVLVIPLIQYAMISTS